ncbi:ESX secretion-associated protein EspG [Actinokineospora inagensis]|uniref:ESX secretion-associated protein EspG n=1 Tax=Actinokineospora inagensis TaxID=103730 RepID=UPI001FE10A1B|nr:ESX secretion-associated protein EspG [Actinokineospora inagensis]
MDREVVLAADCLLVGAQEAGVALPAWLSPDPIWRNPEETQAHNDDVRLRLAEHGLWRAGKPTEEFLRTMTVLGRGALELTSTVESPAVGRYHLHVAAGGPDAVLACHVPASGQVVLRPLRPDALAEGLLAEIPDAPPAPGPSLSVPESDLRAAINGAPAHRDVRRVLDVAGLPRRGAGQICAGVRDGLGGHRTTGDDCCTFYDTERGRYLFSFTRQPDCERYVNVAPGRFDTMVGKTYDLLNRLRGNGR